MTNDLICPAEEIFDRAAIDTAIASAFAEAAGNTSEFRKNALKILQDAQKLGRTRIEEALAKSPFAARETTHAYTYLTDGLVIAVLKIASTYIHPLATPTEGEKLSVLAVGGYGRGDMAPFSDVDLLFLTPYKITPWAESVIETMLYLLWDLRMKVGHASRTIPDCIRLAKEDFTIRTALLEQRYLAGDEALANKLHTRLRDDLFKSTGREFIAAKLEERDTRHEKQGGQRYVVEPNVKEGKGGLRDLQSMFWIAKYVHGVDDAADLVPLGVFTKDEYRLLVRAEDFLWATRCHLHLVTNRPTEQLTFDLQVEIASRMGYVDTGGRRAVEHFMQDYFRHATSVGDLTRIFLTSLEASHNKPGPSLATLFRRRKKLRDGYKEINNRLAIVNDKEFLSDPLNFLQLFDEALRTGLLIHPDAMRLVVANLKLINDEMRNDPAANKIFLDLLLKRGNPERALRRMNELGVLAAFMPEFAPIVAMMQFNMYHSYTVDEHTIQCISQMAQIERQELTEPLPLASSIFDEGLNRKVLYVAMLLHDIGKGRKEDHSILGAQIARRVTPRLGLKKEECETVEWLVRYHLLMSDVAQKRDISDPRTVRDFAKVVKNRKRLDLLTVLTVCDIRGVGPDTWNNWKAMLLRQLHAETAKALEHGLEEINRETRGNEARKALRDALPKWSEADLKHETKRHYPPYWTGLPPQTHVIFAELLKDIPDDEIRIDLKPDTDRDATRACFAMADHPGIFARLAGALALVGANVVDARTYTSKDGYATAVFWVQDADGHPYEESRLPRLRDMIGKTLKGEVLAGKALKDKDKFKKREKAFRVPTHITFDNEGSEIYTIIEVDTRDRPGLLYDLARTLSGANVYISSAVIATYGEQVVDTFYVKDMFGLKFHSASRRESLEKKLREAIDKGVERAIA
ncbi:[protein-PII] uridylyltransferase [Donghicola mangrovi]|uniref:Bifunctional uridylyltransferase/uridylyl-removing enzyme n=1 Tax=Donghicola mangrovi TaxID=2729614 RepID=A0A850Q568_9RHOB|nr:[protein-PII] uridylyltransferase [Donghicola mangrovi]NVO21790.1 [protein-PII] uridylyltransferase [Donghicola mangrovi]